MTEEHGCAVQGVILRCDDIWLTDAVPVEGTRENRLEEVAVRQVIRPLPLSLKTSGDRIVAFGLFAVAELRQPRVTDHQVARDQRHLNGDLPVAVLLLARAAVVRLVPIFTFGAVLANP